MKKLQAQTIGCNNLKLYIHIPFCVKKCAYCDFLSFEKSQQEHEAYVNALLNEIKTFEGAFPSSAINSIFFGGGTPSAISKELFVAIMNQLKCTFQIEEDAEITVEVNPGTASLEKFIAYNLVGVNRLSIGLQATNDEELKALGRIHNYATFISTYNDARRAGFKNINVDLITAIPNQTIFSWEETLDRILQLSPEHISAYSLIIEEGTPFYEAFDELETLLPSEKEERAMYHLTKSKLAAAGYERYETSNYAKQGYECRHNLGYWERDNYLGLGLGSASLLDNVRYSNTSDYQEYIEKLSRKKYEDHENLDSEKYRNYENLDSENSLNSVCKMEEVLTRVQQMEEFMFLGLRKIKGVSTQKFYETFGVKLEEIYGDKLEMLLEKKLIEKNSIASKIVEEIKGIGEIGDNEEIRDNEEIGEAYIALTEKGIDLSNTVLAEFLID